MSLRAQTQIWQYSRAKGGQLLVLLAIGDYAHDDGRNAWPSIDNLAKKSRMTERGVRLILRQLEALGEIRIRANTDRVDVDGLVPRRFIDVLCVRPEKASSRPRTPDEGEKISGDNHEPPEIIRKNAVDFDAPEKISSATQRGEKISGKDFRGKRFPEEESCTSPPFPPPIPSPIPPSDREDPSKEQIHRDADASLFALALDPADQVTVLRTRFRRLCAVYPRVEKLKRCWRAFERLNPSDALTDFIIADVERKKRSVWGGTEPKFIPALHNYLADERWTDDVSDVAPYSGRELDQARTWRARAHMGRCPHAPVCGADVDCLKAIAARNREHAARRGRRIA